MNGNDIPSAQPGRAEPNRPSLVCFSHLRWDFVWQRPQHLLCRAARSYDVLFVEEPIIRPDAIPHLHVSTRPGGIAVAVPVLPEGLDVAAATEVQSRLIGDHLAIAPGRPRVLWYYTPMATAFSAGIDADVVVYDNMDELSAFRGASPELLAREAELLSRADLVLTGGRSLYEAKRHRHPDVHAFPSSIDFAHFAAARTRPAEPADQSAIADPKIGFFGVIDERMDLELVADLADLRPDWNLIMIGPVVKIDPAILPRRANIHWLGPKAYDELPRYLGHWRAGFMPFALNESTRFISPTKTPEYLAAGLPLVSTAIRDVVRPYGEDGLVDIAGTGREMAACIERLLEGSRPDVTARVDRHLSTMSWDRTWAAMNDLILGKLDHQAVVSRAGAASPLSIPA